MRGRLSNYVAISDAATPASSSRSFLDYFCPGLDRMRAERDAAVASNGMTGGTIQANAAYDETKKCAVRNLGLAATGTAILGYLLLRKKR